MNAWTLAREIIGAIPRLLVFGAIAAAVAVGGRLDDLGQHRRHQRPRTNPPRPIP